MSDFNQVQYRIDKLVLFYMEKTCDISSMTVEEYIKKESSNTYYSYVLDKKKNAQDSYFTIEYLKQ